MQYEVLQAMIGTAVIDLEFRKALLNGSRCQVIQRFDLTREEIETVMTVRADSIEQFAGQLDQWILRAQGKREPPALALPTQPLSSPIGIK